MMDTDVTYVPAFWSSRTLNKDSSTWTQGYEDDEIDMSTSLISGSIRGYS